jgi:hypothetical protein
MITLLERIGERLRSSAYVNEAAITHGIVTPILQHLGWDTADPRQVVPEFANERGRVDFALIGVGQKPGIFIEVKQVGRAMDGDRQLFEYAFHQGVPMCVLTDGREWSFYLPAGQGSYDDRRFYRLQLDERSPVECQAVLTRYLDRAAVLDQSAYEHARVDYQDIAGQREARAILPQAWAELVTEAHELLIETLVDKAEALCGFSPSTADALGFLQRLQSSIAGSRGSDRTVPVAGIKAVAKPVQPAPPVPSTPITAASVPARTNDRTVEYKLFGQASQAVNASRALVDILRAITKRDPDRITELSAAVRSRRLNHIARTPGEINPDRPDLARAAEFAPGWLVGLNIANIQKQMIIRAACEVYGLSMPGDVDVTLPNA